MRRLWFAVLALCAAAAAASCARQEPISAQPITLFPPASETATTASPPTTGPQSTLPAVTVNDSYGQTHTLSSAEPVRDASVQYRTEDSYRFEAAAVEHARQLYRQSVSVPESLHISDMQVEDCADDGSAVYYSIYLEGDYRLLSGEPMSRGVFYDLGVRKQSGEVFDASADIDEVLRSYSLLAEEQKELSIRAQDAQSALDALVPRLCKDPRGTKVLSVTPTDQQQVYAIVCEGVNTYGLHIRETRNVELLQDGERWFLRSAPETF